MAPLGMLFDSEVATGASGATTMRMVPLSLIDKGLFRTFGKATLASIFR
jgi:hypothetical protein